MESILLKVIKDGLGNPTGLGEFTPDEVVALTGDIKFADGTVQSTAATSGAIDSVFGRTGAVVAVANDYSALQVSFDPANVTGMDATNVQSAIEQLGSIVKETASDLLFMGLLGFNDVDPAAPAAGGPSHYYIFNTAGTRTVGDATGKVIAVGDWLVYHRVTSKWIHLDYSARQATAAGTTYDPGNPLAKANTYLTASDVQGALDQADAELGAVNTRIDNLEAAPGGVSSFNTRTGAVLPVAGDYTAAQTTFVPVPGITATEVQGAIAALSLKSIPFFDTNGDSKPIPLA
jgi:flagellar basal body rod protein FlgC